MKTITLSAFRKEPGERIRDVARGGESFLLTKSGTPVAMLVPVGTVSPVGTATPVGTGTPVGTRDVVVEPDGTVRGTLLDTSALRRGGGY